MIVQECGVGLVPVRRSPHGQLAFKAPPLIRSGPVEEPVLDEVAASLGIKREDIATPSGPITARAGSPSSWQARMRCSRWPPS